MNRSQIIDTANDIRRDYAQKGLTLTVRQMYYRFVALGHAGSSKKVYDRIQAALAVARYDGRYPLDGIEDRERSALPGDFTAFNADAEGSLDTAGEYLRSIPSWVLSADRWYGQPNHVSVWFEKKALEGVFAPTCRKLGVSWLACKGQPSISVLYQWVRQVERAYQVSVQAGFGGFDRAVVLHFGDHDPTGVRIPEYALDGIRKIRAQMTTGGWEVDLKWVALTLDQVDQYGPPPFMAKPSDRRFQRYCDQFGTDNAWELDALEPVVMRTLARDHTLALFDQDVFDDNEAEVQSAQSDLRQLMSDPEWMASVWGQR